MSRRAVAILTLIVAAFAVPVRAEVIGPLLRKGEFELGAQARWVNREVYYGEEEFDWKESGLTGVARWGITEFATVSVEAIRGAVKIEDEPNDFDFSYFVGGAVQAAVWRNEKFVVSAAFQFTTQLLRFESGSARNVTTSTAGGQIITQYGATLSGIGFDFWGGPAYSIFYLDYENQIGSFNTKELYTESNWGAVVGLDALIWNHVDLSTQLFWVENPQPRVALLYRF